MQFRNKLAGLGLVASVLAAPAAFAQTSTATSITSAVGAVSTTDASNGLYAAIGIVLGLVVISMGAGAVIRMFRRG